MADVVTRVVEDRPVLVTFHGSDLQGNAGNGLLGALSGWYSTVASARAARRAAGVVVVSPHLRDAIAKSVNGSRVWVVPNGVDLGRFRPRERAECQRALGWDTGRAHVLFPARPARGEKRFHLAAAAVAMLRQSGVAVDLHVLDGVPHDEVPTWMNAANVDCADVAAGGVADGREGGPRVQRGRGLGGRRRRPRAAGGDRGMLRRRADAAGSLARASGELSPARSGSRGVSGSRELSLERVADTLREIYGVLTGAR